MASAIWRKGTPSSLARHRDDGVLGVDARTARQDIRLEAPAARRRHRQQRRTGRDHEWFPGSCERGSDRLDSPQVRFCGPGEFAGIRQFVLEGEMDHALGVGGRLAEAIEVVERASPDLDASGTQGPGGLIGPGKADHRVPGGQEIGNDGGPDVPGGAGDEKPHARLSYRPSRPWFPFVVSPPSQDPR
jgi:hypothetical protein